VRQLSTSAVADLIGTIFCLDIVCPLLLDMK
jgi:hypothetical protein